MLKPCVALGIEREDGNIALAKSTGKQHTPGARRLARAGRPNEELMMALFKRDQRPAIASHRKRPDGAGPVAFAH